MIKKVITITVFLLCLKLVPLFSCGGYMGTAPALHPIVMSPDIMLIEEKAKLGYDVEKRRFIVNLELVYENRGESKEAKARFRTGKTFDDTIKNVRGEDFSLKFNVNVNSKQLKYKVVSEISANDHHFEDFYYQFEADYKKGRNVVEISFEERLGKYNVFNYSHNEVYCSFYLEDIYKKSLRNFVLEFYSLNGNIILQGVPFKELNSAVTFDSYSMGESGRINIMPSRVDRFLLIYEGETVAFKNHKFGFNRNSLHLDVHAFYENNFKYLVFRTYDYITFPILFTKEQRKALGKELDDFNLFSLTYNFMDYSKEFDMKQLDSRIEEFVDILYYHYLAGFRYPFPNRAKVREAFHKVPFYFPDDKFSFNNLSEQAQQRFLMLNSYRNNRLQPEIYQPFVKNLRVRSEPGLKGKVVGKLALFKQVRLLERGELTEIDGLSGNWVLIEDSRGLKGWCFDGYMEGM